MTPIHVPMRRLLVGLLTGRSGPRKSPGLVAPWLVITVAVGISTFAMQPSLALAQPTEEAVKAALIFNLTKFVEWPATTFSSPHAPFVVAILGKDAVGDLLKPVLLKKNVNGHPILVRFARTPEEARASQVVYVARSEQRRAAEIIEALRGASTLSVADLDRFAQLGGHVNLVLEDQRVRILVNPTSAEASNLKISARLLSVAQIVETAP